MLKEHIRSTIENFFLCTNIPVKAFSFDNFLLCTSGFDDRLNSLFTSNNVLETVKNKLSQDCKKSFITINCKDSIIFAACRICPCCDNNGFYVIGPYASDAANGTGVPYKPGSCIPHLFSLLRNIEKDCCLHKVAASHSKPVYSFHIKKAVTYINNNFHSPITLESISDTLKINKSYLCAVLKKETGKTFCQLLNEARIEKSKELLSDQSMSILEVSMAAGYNNQNYFNKIFKKLTDKTPLEFRDWISSMNI